MMRNREHKGALDALLDVARRTKVLHELRADFPCGLAIMVCPDGTLLSCGRRPNGELRSEVERLLVSGKGEITANHGVTGRVVRLGRSVLLR